MNNKRTVINQENIGYNNSIDPLQNKRRKEWTSEWLKTSQFDKELLPELRINEVYHFNSCFKMTEKQFTYLVNKIASQITNQEPTRKRKAFTAEERLAVTLKYLATGEVHTCKHYGFRATQEVIISMIADICMKIYENLKDDYIKIPKTEEEWREVSKGFYDKYELPNCVGVLEARHILFRAKRHINKFKRTYDEKAIMLMAVLDSELNFLYIDVGQPSNVNQCDVFNHSQFKDLVDNNEISLPMNNNKMPESAELSVPSYFIGRPHFPLKPYLMTQYYVNNLNQLFFDFRLWQVDKQSLNLFELLQNIFPIFLDPFKLSFENTTKITLGCVALYNYLRKTGKIDLEEENQKESFETRPGCFLNLEHVRNEIDDKKNKDGATVCNNDNDDKNGDDGDDDNNDNDKRKYAELKRDLICKFINSRRFY